MSRPTNAEVQIKKEKVYNFIVKYINEHGYAPVYREIREETGIRSLDTICRYLYQLKEENKIDFIDGAARTITLK